tara:strand:+ start:152917 stop:154227 length:1311 start_codon:yes stop_codon:yes gene_type:complete
MSDTNTQISDLINELEWRGLLKDCTDKDGLRKHLESGTRKIYAGFDPTADSLTIGNLVPIMLLAHVKRAGHTPIVVMGGGTGLIGDPSGKSAERQLNTAETIDNFINKQRPIFSSVLGDEGKDFLLKNNHDWLSKISFIEALRDIGKHFSVNMMMQKESVKERLNNREQGISYTEFSYMILQSYDFSYLYEHEDITVQLGGSDQFGNIVAGSDLIRRQAVLNEDEPAKTFGLTAPLVSKADGGKFGKTEKGAIWLTANRTSPYAYYQFWLNSSDEDAKNWIKVFTFLPQDEVEGLIARHGENPGKRELQRTLAQEATMILHGKAEMENAEAAGKALFSGDISSLDATTMLEVFASVPTTEHAKADLADGVDMIEMLKGSNLASSNREAREFLNEGSVSINGTKITIDTKLTQADLLHGQFIAIRRGKKKWHMTKWA